MVTSLLVVLFVIGVSACLAGLVLFVWCVASWDGELWITEPGTRHLEWWAGLLFGGLALALAAAGPLFDLPAVFYAAVAAGAAPGLLIGAFRAASR